MRYLLGVLLVAVMVVGCTTKKEKKEDQFRTKITPEGGTYVNGVSVTVTITANRDGAVIYYDVGGAGQQQANYPPGASFQVTGSDETITVTWHGEWTDPNSGMTYEEAERSVDFVFEPDTEPPSVSISPSSGTYSSRMDISITANDNDPNATVTLEWRTAEDGGAFSAWQSTTGTGSASTSVSWTSGYRLDVEAKASDSNGNQSATQSRYYIYQIDYSAMAREVMDLINQERDNQGVDPLNWNSTIGDACQEHAEQLSLADAADGMPNTQGADGKTLWDRLSSLSMNKWATGIKDANTDTAEKFVNLLMGSASIKAVLLDPTYTDCGCGVVRNSSSGDWYWSLCLAY